MASVNVTPTAPQVGTDNMTNMANNMIVGGYKEYVNTFAKMQERVFQQSQINEANAAEATQMAASALGRKGYENLVMEFKNKSMAELNRLTKNLRQNPMDAKASGELQAYKANIKGTLENLAYTNQLFDAFNAQLSDPKLTDEVLNGANLEDVKQLYASIDNGDFSIDAYGNISGFGESGDFSTMLAGRIPTLFKPVDEIGAIASDLEQLGVANDEFSSYIKNVNGRTVLISTDEMSATQQSKLKSVISNKLFGKDGNPTQVAEKWMYSHNAAYENGVYNVAPKDKKELIDYVYSMFNGKKTSTKEQVETTIGETANQKKVNDQTSEYTKRLRRGYLGTEGEVAFLTNKPLTMEIYGSDGSVYGTNARITGVKEIIKPTKEGELAKYKINIATIGEDNKLSEPKEITLDLNNELHRGLFNSMLKESSNQFAYARVPSAKDVVGFDLVGIEGDLSTPDLTGEAGRSKFSQDQQSIIESAKRIVGGDKTELEKFNAKPVLYDAGKGAVNTIITGIKKDGNVIKIKITGAIKEDNNKLPSLSKEQRNEWNVGRGNGAILEFDLSTDEGKGRLRTAMEERLGYNITPEMVDEIFGTTVETNKYGI